MVHFTSPSFLPINYYALRHAGCCYIHVICICNDMCKYTRWMSVGHVRHMSGLNLRKIRNYWILFWWYL